MKAVFAKHLLVLVAGILFANTATAQMGMGKPKEIKELGDRNCLYHGK